MYFSSDDDSETSSSSSKSTKTSSITENKIVSNEYAKFVISDELLEKLTDRIKIIANFPCQENENENLESEIRKFISDSYLTTLFIFVENKTLKAKFTVPEKETECVYFIKENPVSDINESNFLQSIIFGSVGTNFENTLLLMLKYIFTCILYSMKVLPYRIMLQTTKKLEIFLSSLTDVFYKSFGLHGIYIPTIILIMMSIKLLHPVMIKEDILNLCENIMAVWCKQINNAIYDEEINHQYCKEFSPLIINQFWEYKYRIVILINQCYPRLQYLRLQMIQGNFFPIYECYLVDNLTQIQKYIEEKNSRVLFRVLEHNSIHLKLVRSFQESLKIKIQQAKCNIQFLKTMKQLSGNLNLTYIKNVPELFLKIFPLMNIITQESKYFNLQENKALLLMSTTYQIINICKRNIKSKQIFQGDTEESMMNIIDSVRLCNMYKEILKQDKIFNNTTKLHSRQILIPIDLFVQRCADISELCSLINIFFTLSHEQKEQRTKMEYYINMKNDMHNIWDMFTSNLNELKINIEEDIVGFQNKDWCCFNYTFQNKIDEIYHGAKFLVGNALLYVLTIEDEVDILRITYQYSKLQSLKTFFTEKHNQPFRKFLQEIIEIQNSMLFVKMNLLNGNLTQEQCVHFSFRKKRKLQFLYELLKNCDWLMQKSNESQQKYEECITEMNQFLINEYKTWVGKCHASIFNRLKRPLITNCFHVDGFLEVNIDRKLLKIIKEAYNWIETGFVPNANIDKLLSLAHQILILYRNVETFVLTYNRILTTLTPDEHILYSQILKQCSIIIRPTLLNLHWDNQDHSNRIILEYSKQIQHVEHAVNTYKSRNEEIVHICKLVCLINILQISKTELEEIVQEVNVQRFAFFKKVINNYNKIATNVRALFESFGSDTRQMTQIWDSYVEKIDSLLQSALKCCVKRTFEIFLKHISPDFETGDVLMKIKLSARIDSHQIGIEPNISSILTFFSNLTTKILEIIKLIPRLANEFKLSKKSKKQSYASNLATDHDIEELQQKIYSVIIGYLQEIKTEIEFWNQYETLWKTDSEAYVNEHSKKFTGIKEYESQKTLYIHIIEKLQFKEEVQNIFLFIFDTQKLKLEIIRQCENRLLHFSNILQENVIELLQIAENKIHDKYVQLSNVNFKTDDYLTIIKHALNELKENEDEIAKIKEYISLIHLFKFPVELTIAKKHETVINKWMEYRNMIEKFCLKLKISYGIIL